MAELREELKETQTLLFDLPTHWDAAQERARIEKERDKARIEIARLNGVANLLADKLVCYTGSTIPTELREAERAVGAGAESWDSIRRVYVDDAGRKV